MSQRAWAWLGAGVVAAVAIVAAAPREIPRGGSAGKVEAKLSLEECREIAADFLRITPEELLSEEGGVLEGLRTTGPPFWTFVLPYGERRDVEDWERELGSVRMRVNAFDGQVISVQYNARQGELGDLELAEAEARASAEVYLKARWPHWPRARFLAARKPQRYANTVGRAPDQSFTWVVEDHDVRVGWAFVTVNITTGQVTFFSQWYYSADALPPRRVTKEQALAQGNSQLAKLPPEQRRRTRMTECYLMTRWRSGKTVLVWNLSFLVPARRAGGGYHEAMGREHTLMLDAHTGEVYHPLFPQHHTGR